MPRYAPGILEHFHHPRCAGRLEPPARCGRGRNAACGDDLRLWVRVAAGRVERAAFQARACTGVIAVASMTAEALQGLSLEEARRLDPARLAEAAGGLPRSKAHAAEVVRRARDEALGG